MALIAGVTIRWGLSPRIIVIPIAEIEVSLTDLQDTLQDLEDDSQGMPFPKLRSMTGGQELDATTNVGFTMQLQNAQLIWQTNNTVLDSGTITTPDAAGLALIDSTALFITNGVVPGDMLLNITDNSHATVLSIVSETQLQVDGLTGGTDNQFDSADSYAVHDWQLRKLVGGNLVAINSAGASISPVINSFGNSFDRTSSSSATLQELQDVQFSSFAGGVWVDFATGAAGTTFPQGTERQPVSNFADGLAIASARGFNTFYIRGDATIDSGLDYTDFVFIGQGQNLSTLTVSSAATVVNCSFQQAEVTGTLDGDSRLFGCIVSTLSFVSGVIENCILAAGTITLGGSAQAQLVNCASGVAGTGTPIINMGGSGQDLTMRNYSGGIKIENKTGADVVSLDLSSGQVILDDATVTAGVIIVRGVGKLRSESGADIPSGAYNGTTIVNELIEGIHLREIHKYLNLDPSDPMEFNTTDARSVSGDIDIDIAASSILPGGNRFTRQ